MATKIKTKGGTRVSRHAAAEWMCAARHNVRAAGHHIQTVHPGMFYIVRTSAGRGMMSHAFNPHTGKLTSTELFA